jgi:hypothetical protein
MVYRSTPKKPVPAKPTVKSQSDLQRSLDMLLEGDDLVNPSGDGRIDASVSVRVSVRVSISVSVSVSVSVQYILTEHCMRTV